MEEMVDAGLATHLGVSNFSAAQASFVFTFLQG